MDGDSVRFGKASATDTRLIRHDKKQKAGGLQFAKRIHYPRNKYDTFRIVKIAVIFDDRIVTVQKTAFLFCGIIHFAALFNTVAVFILMMSTHLNDQGIFNAGETMLGSR